MTLLAAPLAATFLTPLGRRLARRASAQHYPGPLMEGGLEELRELLFGDD